MEGRWEINRRDTYLPPFIKWTVGKFERDIRWHQKQRSNYPYHTSNGGIGRFTLHFCNLAWISVDRSSIERAEYHTRIRSLPSIDATSVLQVQTPKDPMERNYAARFPECLKSNTLTWLLPLSLLPVHLHWPLCLLPFLKAPMPFPLPPRSVRQTSHQWHSRPRPSSCQPTRRPCPSLDQSLLEPFLWRRQQSR